MKEIAAWVQRLLAVELASKSASSPNTPNLAESYHPLLTRGFEPLTIRGSFFGIQGYDRLAQRIGDAGPTTFSILRILDQPNPKPVERQELADEIGALVCAASEGWTEVVHAIPLKVEGKTNTTFMNTASAADFSLNRPLNQLGIEHIQAWLAAVASLQESDAGVIGAAIRLHHGATLLFERDLRSAYLLLVAGVELLSRQYGSPPSEWADWEDSTSWDDLMSEINFDQRQRDAVRTKLLADKHLRLKLTFRKYGANRLPDTFWEGTYRTWNFPHDANSGMFQPAELFKETPIGELVPRDRALLSASLGRSYDVRSGLVHRGERLSFMQAAIAPWNIIDGTKLLPFAILRLILLELIKTELKERSTEIKMPDVVLQF